MEILVSRSGLATGASFQMKTGKPWGREELIAEAIQGVIHGRTIELETDPGIEDGQAIEVVVRVVARSQAWGEGIRRSAGAMAEHWTEDDDRVLEAIRRDRHRSSRPELTS